MSKLIIALCKILDIKQHHTSAYHPNTIGLVERQNRTLASSLRTYCGKDQEKWPELLPGILMGFRRSPSSHSTKYSPYYLLFGEEMRLPFDVSLEPKDNINRETKQNIHEFIENLKITKTIVENNIQWHKQQNKERHDVQVKVPDFQIGDKVLIKVNKVHKGLSSKLYDKAGGPYRIIELGPNLTYKLKRCSDNKVNASYMNATNLRLYHDPDIDRDHLNADVPNQQIRDVPEQTQRTNDMINQEHQQQTDHNTQAQPPEQQTPQAENST